VGVFGENDPPFGNGFSKQSSVARICRSLAQIGDIVAGSPHRLRHNVGIDEKALRYLAAIVRPAAALTHSDARRKTGVDIRRLEHGIRFQNGLPAGTLGERGQHHRRGATTTPDHGLATHFLGVGGDTSKEISFVHPQRLTWAPPP
jgi:hypothetical protein